MTKTDFTPRPSDDIAPRLTDYGLPIKQVDAISDANR